MSLPFFFSENNFQPDEETSRHIVQVLRMKEGEHLLFTDGKGNAAECEITAANKKKCTVTVVNSWFQERPSSAVSIAISMVKNTSRFEWFLEKATELGVAEIIPLVCERTEKHHFRHDRLMNICRSAMLQSRQVWQPELSEPVRFSDVISRDYSQKIIAHCGEGPRQELFSLHDSTLPSHLILIGPEGDFTSAEIEDAMSRGFLPASLGRNRLRTETAGIYAAVVCST